ncbi:MAG: DUF389 domain-containing protein [Acidobacteriota bacterium]
MSGSERLERRSAWWRTLVRRWARLRMSGDQAAAQRSIGELVPIRNEKLWFLVASAVIASVGLNTNSVAVVIGAMLISPQMGPIVGLGYGLAVRDRPTARRSAVYVGVSVGLPLLVSTVYFFASPLQDATAEILARTKPNLLDLLVALAAAIAGVIALTNEKISAALPGVAIAIAIMPPLCAAGYGLATGQWAIAMGAFYLFAVNAMAIVLCAYVLFRRMHFVETAAESGSQMSRWLALGVTTAFLLPLCYSLYSTVHENTERRIARAFVRELSAKHRVTTWQFSSGAPPTLSIFLFDQPSEAERTRLTRELAQRLPKARLEILTTDLSPEVRRTLESLRTSVIDSSTALARIQTALAGKRREEQEAARRKAEAEVASRPRIDWKAVEAEWKVLEPRLSQAELYEPASADQPRVVLFRLRHPPSRAGQEALRRKWEEWLSLRLGGPTRLVDGGSAPVDRR